MYKNLININLESYLDQYFFAQEYKLETWLVKLESFVESLPDDQKLVLKNKFNPKLPHLSKNNLLHEIMVACAFYPHATFNTASGADLIDGENRIEIKTVNASSVEIERVKVLMPNSRRYLIPKDEQWKNRFEDKFDLRFKKAAEQVNHNGIVYMVWDSDFVIGWKNRKQEIKAFLKKMVRKKKFDEPKVIVRTIYFEDLRELLKK